MVKIYPSKTDAVGQSEISKTINACDWPRDGLISQGMGYKILKCFNFLRDQQINISMRTFVP